MAFCAFFTKILPKLPFYDFIILTLERHLFKKNIFFAVNPVSSTRSAHLVADRILQDRTHYLQQHLPLLANDFIEDHDPEWRDLDYSSGIKYYLCSKCHFCRISIPFNNLGFIVGERTNIISAHHKLK